ncbi:MAG: transporter [Hyphococcus sp.]|nr:MAG: transporter [Marinicaulis sp.]
MDAVISTALPVFGIIAAGLIAGRFGFMNLGDSQALNKFVFRFAMPAALFGLTANATPPGAADVAIALSYGVAAFVILIGGYLLTQRMFSLTKPEAGAHAFSSTLGNAVFLGLPIALSIEGWARPFIVLMLVEGIAVIAIGAALMAPRKEGGKNLLGYFSGPARNPLVLGMVAGFLYSALGLPLTGPFETFFSLLGRAAGPTALFSMGLFLATHQFPPIAQAAGRVSSIAILKLIVLPIIALGVAYLLQVNDPAYLGALALFVFVPSGVGCFIMASQYGIYQTETAAAISVTTILSVLTISGVLIVFA